MRKFKLVKKFPGSIIEKGDIVESDGLGQYVHEKTIAIFQEEDVLDYPEFWKEIKEFCFISADGIELFEGDAFYVPQRDQEDRLTGDYIGYKAGGFNTSAINTFSTKGAVEEYINKNKPLFSYNDIVDNLGIKANCFQGYKLNKLFKTKIKCE